MRVQKWKNDVLRLHTYTKDIHASIKNTCTQTNVHTDILTEMYKHRYKVVHTVKEFVHVIDWCFDDGEGELS